MKKSITVAMSLLLVFALTVSVFASNAVSAPTDFTNKKSEIFSETGKIALTQGAQNGDVNFSWVLSKSVANESFVYGLAADLSDGISAEVNTIVDGSFLYNINRVSLTGLLPGTYYYKYTCKGEWQAIGSFKIADTSTGFTAMFCSDPQLGRADDDSDSAILDDCYGWSRTLTAAAQREPDMSFIMCAGDQVNVAVNTDEYNALLYPTEIKNYPLVTAVGNHDFYSPFYAYHFFNPNVSESEVLSTAGNDYYYSYGNTLFIVLNSNNFLIEDHRAALNNAVKSYPDAMWRVVMLHESMYFPGSGDKNDVVADIFTPMFDEFDIDLVLSGHEHIYSRTVPLTAGKSDVKGVTYLAASSASGCNFYSADGADSKIAAWQNSTEPSYSMINFTDTAITVKSYGTDSGDMFDEFSITKDAPSSGDTGYEAPLWYTQVVELFLSIMQVIKDSIPFDFVILK